MNPHIILHCCSSPLGGFNLFFRTRRLPYTTRFERAFSAKALSLCGYRPLRCWLRCQPDGGPTAAGPFSYSLHIFVCKSFMLVAFRPRSDFGSGFPPDSPVPRAYPAQLSVLLLEVPLVADGHFMYQARLCAFCGTPAFQPLHLYYRLAMQALCFCIKGTIALIVPLAGFEPAHDPA